MRLENYDELGHMPLETDDENSDCEYCLYNTWEALLCKQEGLKNRLELYETLD